MTLPNVNSKYLVFSIATLSGLAVCGALIFGLFTLNKMNKENLALRQQIEEKASELQTTNSSTTISNVTQNNDEVATGTQEDAQETKQENGDSNEDSQKVIVHKEVVYVPQKVSTSAPEPSQEATSTKIENALITPEANITVTGLKQTIYLDEYKRPYGSYQLELSVDPDGGDIFIPMTTTDTMGTGLIGFSYSITSGFKGSQDSQVSCSLSVGKFCKFKSDGQARNVTVTIFLDPDSDNAGNYAVNFENINYYYSPDGSSKQETFSINRKTQTIHLD